MTDRQNRILFALADAGDAGLTVQEACQETGLLPRDVGFAISSLNTGAVTALVPRDGAKSAMVYRLTHEGLEVATAAYAASMPLPAHEVRLEGQAA